MARFGFGKNWLSYAETIDEERYSAAESSIRSMLEIESLENKSFLDAGSGSGLFSLAAHHIGASPVVSFDYDHDSVASTKIIRKKYAKNPKNWEVSWGDVLDAQWLSSLGEFDYVYSWGVLHHTGAMWTALDNICASVKPGGVLFISLYNDQGWVSKFWTWIKQRYVGGGKFTQASLVLMYIAYFLVARTAYGIFRLQPPSQWFLASGRGMNVIHDAVDWVGGYPFEVAKPSEIERFFSERYFTLTRSNLKSGSGCNEFVFSRNQYS